MNSNRQLIKSAISSSETMTGAGKGGMLSPAQAKRFISYMIDSSEVLKDTRLEEMTAPEKQLDFILIGSRLIRKATEASRPTELVGADISRKELRSVKVRLAADITSEFLEDNIEGQQAADTIAKELAQQFSNDLADLMFNGDTAAIGADAGFLNIGDGIIKQALNSTATQKYDWDSTAQQDFKGVVFPKMLSLLPNKFKRNRKDMRFYCSSNVADSYIRSLSDRVSELGDRILTTGSLVKYLGVQLFPVEYIPDDVIILTNRLNIVSGVQREMKVYSRFNQRKDLTEYTMYMRVDPGKIILDNALVIAAKLG